MLDRTDRSLVGVWWWTVDRWLLACTLILMVVGTLLVMAAGPAVAFGVAKLIRAAISQQAPPPGMF